MSNFPRRAFVTSDGVQLSYIRQGSGRPIVLIHGWSQCAEEFKHEAEQVTRQTIDGMVTRHATSEMRERIGQCNLKMPRPFAGTLLYNLCHTDWRDLVPRIKLPTLIISETAKRPQFHSCTFRVYLWLSPKESAVHPPIVEAKKDRARWKDRKLH